jgi:hypothetical protein
VFGTQSVAYISSSQLNIGTNLITVNTDTPSIRFGGLAVYDSGSTGLTGSLLWDSQNNHWVYSNPSGSSYSGGMFISGPRTSTLGSETGTTSCMLLAGQGGDHLTSSMIYHSSTVTCYHGNSYISASGAAYFVSNVGINCSSVSGRTLTVKGIAGGTQVAEFISSNGCDSMYIAPNVSGVNLFSGNYLAGSGGYKSLAISARENTGDFVLTNTGIASFNCQVCVPQLVVRSSTPNVQISSTNYEGLYKSFFGSLNSAEGIIQLGNNGANYFLIGNTSAGGYLQFRTNINTDYGYSCGLEALTIYCNTSVCFAGPVKLAGAFASCLGLGTTSSPAKYLHIEGTNNFTQGIRFSEAAGAYPHNIYFGSPYSSAACWGLDFQVATGAVTSATVLSLRGNCRVGINTTTPSSVLHIVDSSANATTLTIGEAGEVPTIKAGGANTDLRIEAVGGGGFLEFVTNGTNRFRTVGTGETTFTCQICTPGISITSNPIGVEYLIIAGGGGGGWDVGGGGGAGGVLNGSTGIWPGTYNIGIGGGGAGATNGAPTIPNNGFNTYAIGLMAIGGGGGGNYAGGSGLSGGSGGGGSGYSAITNAGFGMKGQGFEGGCGLNVAGTSSTGGAGGGAGAAGASSINNINGCVAGGTGIISTIIGEYRSYGCGGRGGGDSWSGNQPGRTNTGDGGDGAGVANGTNAGSNGGSGLVIIKIRNTNSASFSAGVTTYTCTHICGYNIYVVTAGAGTITIS